VEYYDPTSGLSGTWTTMTNGLATPRDYLGATEVRRAARQNPLASPAWEAQPNTGPLAPVELPRPGRPSAVLNQNTDESH